MDNRERILKERQALIAGNKNLHLGVCIATTANLNALPLHIGRQRKTKTFAMSNFVLSEESWLREIIECFDGYVQMFLLDCEEKNSVSHLVEKAEKLIFKSKVVHFRANAMTVNALEAFITTHLDRLQGKTASIFGPGNMGCKAALMLAERGAEVRLVGRDPARVQRVAVTLNEICRGTGRISAACTSREGACGSHLLLGCTPGVPVVDSKAVSCVAPQALLIDVGNGTFFPDAVAVAATRGLHVTCLIPDAGFAGLMASLESAFLCKDKAGTRELQNGLRAITPGILGRRGDLLVEQLEDPLAIVGVCDGLGDILPPELAKQYITMALDNDKK